MTEHAITIYDIAKEAGVSPATVSRVLTNSARVSQAKREAVLAIIDKYNFQPNALAKSLSATRSRIIGLMVADIRNPYYAELSVACEDEASRHGYTVLLCNALNEPDLEESHLDKFHAQRVDAIVQIGCRTDDLVSDPKYVRQVNRIARTIPFVSTGSLENGNVYTVGIDHVEGMRLAFEHLSALGHTRIALLGGSLRVRSTYEKWMQYVYLLGQKGIPARKEYIIEGSYDFHSGQQGMRRLLALGAERPTAVIAVNDYTAVGGMASLKGTGISVPRDLSMIGYDNTMIAETTLPGLTSLDYGYETLARGLIGTALRLVEGKSAEREVHIQPKLIVRASCAEAAKVIRAAR